MADPSLTKVVLEGVTGIITSVPLLENTNSTSKVPFLKSLSKCPSGAANSRSISSPIAIEAGADPSKSKVAPAKA